MGLLTHILHKNNKIIGIFDIQRLIAMRHYIYIFFLLPAMLLICNTSIAQQSRTITGRVMDSNSGTPLQYASVLLKNSTLSTVTNSDGKFTFKVPVAHFGDSLMVSYLGYKNITVAVSDFNPKRDKRIVLQPSFLDIRGITVRTDDAKDLFYSAFSSKSRRLNYLNHTAGMNGFYRETIKKGNKYLSLTEAVVDISKQSYTSLAADNVSIYKGRTNTNRNATDTLFLQLQGGPVTSLNLDIVKDPFVGTDLLTASDYYHFTMGPMMFMDDMNIYTIDFNQVPGSDEILFRGRIYVESQTLAIVRIEFEMNLHERKDAWKQFVRKKPDNVQIRVDWAKYQVNYKNYSDKWYLDYVRVDLRFNAKYQGKWLKNKYDIITELAITDIDSKEAAKIPYSSRLRMKDILQKKVADFKDESFWEDYNIIQPDEKIENIINKIIRQLKKRDDN